MDIKELKKRLLAFTLLLSMITTMNGCSFSKSKNQKEHANIRGMLEGIETSISYFEIERRAVIAKYLGELNLIQGVYPYQEYYLSSADVDFIIKRNEDDGCPNIIQGDLNAALLNLAKQISNNSLEYMEENADGNILNINDLDKNLNLTNTIYQCLVQVFKNPSNNVGEDLCSFSNVKIVFAKENRMAAGRFVPKTRTIYLFWETLINDAKKVNRSLEEELFLVLSHEFLHVRQAKCMHRSNTENALGLEYIIYSIPFFVESSAESALYNLGVDENCKEKYTFDYTYIPYRKGEAYLFLLALTSDSLDGYYNAIFDADLKQLFEYFNLHSRKDIEDFYRILFAIDSKNLRTNLISKVHPEKAITYGELKQLVGYGYRIDLFRMALQNLLYYTCCHNDFSLEEHLLLFNYIKMFIADETFSLKGKGDVYVEVYDSDFVQSFLAIEEVYNEFLSEFYNISINDIKGLEERLYQKGEFKIFSYQEPSVLTNDAEIFQKFPVLRAMSFANPVSYFAYLEFKSNSQPNLKRSIS